MSERDDFRRKPSGTARLLRAAQGPSAAAAAGGAVRDAAAETRARSHASPRPPICAPCSRDVDDVRLEIGFGGAEHLIAQAQALSRARGFIGSDGYLNAIAKALAAIDDGKLANIRLHLGDASALIDWLPAGALARIDLLYPDPWPKRRHWKRRFIQDDSLKRLARILKSRRRTALRHRHRRLCGLCAGARAALEGFRLDRGKRGRLAQSLARIFPARAMKPRPSAKAARRPISFSAEIEPKGRHARAFARASTSF